MTQPGADFSYPVLPLRDVVVFPTMVMPLFVGREKSIRALQHAMQVDKKVLLVTQRESSENEPSQGALYDVGTMATILQLLRLPDGTVKLLVEGRQRALVREYYPEDAFARALVTAWEEPACPETVAVEVVRKTLEHFEGYVKKSKKISNELVSSIQHINQPSRLIDTIAAHITFKLEDKQAILETNDIEERANFLAKLLTNEMDLLQVEKRIRGRVKKQMERSQREYYLNEQMKAIQKELDGTEDGANEMDQIQKKIDGAGMHKDAKTKAMQEFNKLKQMSPMAAEATVIRGYLDWLINLPWKTRSKIRYDLKESKKLLNTQHYGLEEVKERILEYLAVQSRVKKLKGPVLCLVGPPGVGKTSLGKSIAEATERKFVRMALGGVRDEAEIRGHRRTYIGSMPGKLLQKISKVNVKNPLFLLDEIDKMGADVRGDPASALLEVLDPEQNNAFNDHYLEVDYDLSEVLFICTANSMDIPPALLDRMEVIRIPGYTEDEKIAISKNHLIGRALEENGLKESEINFDEAAVRDLIRYYTKESGVRGLQRAITKICRKVVKEQALDEVPVTEGTENGQGILISTDNLEHYHGVRKYNYGRAGEEDRVGIVTGLAWTSVGGELLTIEAVAMSGQGKHVKTGSLGDVMQESIQAAFTVVRSRSAALGIDDEFYQKQDLHIHVPEGATPKDGPSAGIGMCTALVSVLTGIPVKKNVAMTGEITLRGEVLPIGGLKEKLLAAHRGGITTVLIPKENERDLKEVPDNIKADLEIRAVAWIDEVLEIALTKMPSARVSDVEESSMTTPVESDGKKTPRISTH